MAETALLVPDFEYPYSTLLAARLGLAIEGAGARAVVAAGAPAVLPVASEVLSEHGVLSVARLAQRCRARHVIWLGAPRPGLVRLLGRRLFVIGLATPQADAWLARARRRLGYWLAPRRLFAGWVSLVTDPWERQFLRATCELHEPLSARAIARTPGAARRVVAYADDAASARTIAQQLERERIAAEEVAFLGVAPDDGAAFARLPLEPIAPGVRRLFTTPQLEVALDARAAGVAVTLVSRPGDEASARRAAYLSRRLWGVEEGGADSAERIARSVAGGGTQGKP